MRKSVEERVTPLRKLQRKGNVLEGPFKKLTNISFSSWINEIIPEVLWSVLIVSALPRESALTSKISKHKQAFGKGRLDHSKLASLSQEAFNLLFAAVLANKAAQDALIPLLVLDALPDKARWSTLLPQADLGQAWNKLATAVANTYDHQSQAATDCRWLKVMTAITKDELRPRDESEQRRYDDLTAKTRNRSPDRHREFARRRAWHSRARGFAARTRRAGCVFAAPRHR